jgi:hypothetical protein
VASLVQDVWLGFDPRLRARRLAPWDEAPVRLVFLLDTLGSLDDSGVTALLELLAESLEVVAWRPRLGAGGLSRPPAGVVEETRALVEDTPRRFGPLPLVVGGHGLGASLALAVAGSAGVRAAFALAPTLVPSRRGEDGARPATEALARALEEAPTDLPLLVVEGRERPPAEAERAGQWLAPRTGASRLLVPGDDDAVLAPPWPAVVRAWALAKGGFGGKP